MFSVKYLAFAATLFLLSTQAYARDIGEVNTKFQLIGPSSKVKIAAFEDPKVEGITCFISRAVTGGVSGAIGVAEDASDASLFCQQTGPIKFKEAIKTRDKGEEVFDERRSFLFKQLHVSRFYDAASQSLVYLSWSDKLLDGSPKNAVTAVIMRPWGDIPPEPVKLAK